MHQVATTQMRLMTFLNLRKLLVVDTKLFHFQPSFFSFAESHCSYKNLYFGIAVLSCAEMPISKYLFSSWSTNLYSHTLKIISVGMNSNFTELMKNFPSSKGQEKSTLTVGDQRDRCNIMAVSRSTHFMYTFRVEGD